MALPRPVESAGLLPRLDTRRQPLPAPAVLSELAGQGTRTRPQQRSGHRGRTSGHGLAWLCRGLWSRQASYRRLDTRRQPLPAPAVLSELAGQASRSRRQQRAGLRRVGSATDKHGSAAACRVGRAPTATFFFERGVRLHDVRLGHMQSEQLGTCMHTICSMAK